MQAACPAGAAAQAPACDGADTAVTASSAAAAEASVLCLVNVERTTRDLAAVSADGKLTKAARGHTADMLERQAFAHSTGDDTPAARAKAAGYAFSLLGENIATGQATPRAVMAAWMGSEGHCRNVLDPGMTQLGVGTVAGVVGEPGTDGATWTQLFGRPLDVAAPAGPSAPQEGCPYRTLAVAPVASAESGTTAAKAGGGGAGTPGAAGDRSGAGASSTPRAAAPAHLSTRVRRRGRTVTVRGHVTHGARSSRVLVTLRRGTRTVRRAVALRSGGRFHVRLHVPRGAGALVLQISGAGVSALRRLR
jgi:uncharacterized protein YkwD